MTNLFNYQTQSVRDLAYSCFGASLVKHPGAEADAIHCHLKLNEQRQAWLDRLDKNPTALKKKLEQLNNKRLGIYFEALWQFFIEEDPELDLVAANLPVRENGKTLGEFDLIYYEKNSEKYFHLEIAVKFYLGLSNKNTACQSNWWGPNCNDRLDLKLKRLFDHQCHLSQTRQGMQVLEKAGCTNVQREIAVMGILFYPYDSHQQPQGVDSGHRRGEWYSHEEFSKKEFHTDYWKTLMRSQWLSPYNQSAEKTPGTYKDIVEQLACYFQVNDRPLMICSMDKGKTGYYEKKRYFITKNAWPGDLTAAC